MNRRLHPINPDRRTSVRRLPRVILAALMLLASRLVARDVDCKPDVMRIDKITKARQEIWVQMLSGTSFGASLFSTSETRVFVTMGRYGAMKAINIEINKREKSGAVAAFESAMRGAKGRPIVFGFRNGGEPLSLVITEVNNQTKVDQGVFGSGDIVTSVVMSAAVPNRVLLAMRQAVTSRQIDAVRVGLSEGALESSIDDKNGRRLMEKFACFYQALDKSNAFSGSDEDSQQTSAPQPGDAGAPAAAPARPQPRVGSEITMDQVVQLVKAKLGDDVILTMLQSSHLKAEATTDDLIRLKGAGASGEVMRAVVAAGAAPPPQLQRGVPPAEPARPGIAKPEAPTSRLETTIAFKTGQVLPLDLGEGPVSINTLEVTKWPKPDKVRAAQAKASSVKITIRFTYSNPDDRDWKCVYRVSVLDDKDVEIGSGDRDADLDKRHSEDTNDIDVKVRASDFERAAKLRIKIEPRSK